MSYHIQKQEKETQKLNFFFLLTPQKVILYTCRDVSSPSGSCWLYSLDEKYKKAHLGTNFSLLVTVISDKLDHLISELIHVKCIAYLALLLEIRKFHQH